VGGNTNRQEAVQNARAQKVDDICIYMASKGFRSPADCFKEFFSNPKCNARQSGFYKKGGGFEDVLNIAVFYYSHGLQKRARKILMKQGLTVSPSTSEVVMREMAKAVRQKLRECTRKVPQVISIDNVNQKVNEVQLDVNYGYPSLPTSRLVCEMPTYKQNYI
jgi:hypothetical protein